MDYWIMRCRKKDSASSVIAMAADKSYVEASEYRRTPTSVEPAGEKALLPVRFFCRSTLSRVERPTAG